MKHKVILLGVILLALMGFFSGCGTVPPFEESQATTEVATSQEATQATTTAVQTPKPGITEGKLALDFEVTTDDGQVYKLSDLRGKRVLVNFFASWCPPCIAEMPDITEVYEETKDSDIVILGVNLLTSENSKQDVLDMIEEYSITFPVGYDETGKIASAYGIRSIPTSLIIDAEGVIVVRKTGAFRNKDEIYSYFEQAE